MPAARRSTPSSVAAEDTADRIYREIKPRLIEMIERNDPAVAGLTFNDIEANSAAVGDLLAKLLMQRAVGKQPPPTDEEMEDARREALKKADPVLTTGRKPEELRVKRIPGKERSVKTARGEVRYAREYLYFPDLKVGIFPPGQTPGSR
jgi:hypothetical protein